MNLPFAPLEKHVRHAAGLTPARRGIGSVPHGTWTAQHCADAFDVHARQVARWRNDGLTPKVADRLAVHVGLHPYDVWGDAYYDAEAAAAPRCGTSAGYRQHRLDGEPTCATCRAWDVERQRAY